MGFAMKNLEYLSAKGYLDAPDAAILDIGSQNLYHATPEAIRAFVQRHGRIADEAAFAEEARRLSYFSWPRPGERTSYLSELLDLTSLEYTSYDVCPALKTEIFDLNQEHLPPHYREHFDVVLNFGTSEHITNQLNSFRVMHDALKPGGIFFHQLPSVGWVDHGYFCYHDGFFSDLAKANDYEIVDRWYTLAGRASLKGEDIRDPEQPESAHSCPCPEHFLSIPCFNLNLILRKRVSRAFAIGLELATSHSTLAPEVAMLYEGGSRTFAVEEAPPPPEPVAPPPPVVAPEVSAAAIPGRELLRELGRRLGNRLRLAFSADHPSLILAPMAVSPEMVLQPDGTAAALLPEAPPPVRAVEPPPGPPDALPSSLAARLDTDIPEIGDGPLDAMAAVRKAQALLQQGRIAEAFGHFNRARAIVHQCPHAMPDLRRIGHLYMSAASLAWSGRNAARARAMAVAALEADPGASAPRDLLEAIESQAAGPDTTRRCFVFYDEQRANQIHREAVRRCLEYTAIAGVIGDIYEFGVLAGWSARIFAETMRDFMIMGKLHLYDSFAGLPDYISAVDRESYEIAGRNIWADKMKFPDEFVASLGGSLEGHIKDRLSGVIRAERITTHRGFYADSLKAPIRGKAALVHIDCDLYQSTREVLAALLRDDVFQDGCVLMFDDWNCNKASPHFGERKAFAEFLEMQKTYGASEFFTYGFNGAAFILHRLL